MKKNVLFFLALAMCLSIANAQTLVVPPGPVGTLNQAIANNPGVKTFILQRNFPYLLSGEINITSGITIAAQDGAGKRPILIYAPPPGAPTIDQIFRTSANLTLRGLHLTNRDNLGGLSQRIVRTVADDIRITLDDCIVDESGQTVFRLDGKNNKIYTFNTIASRLGMPNNPDNGRFIDDRGNLVDTIVIDRCAVYNVTSRIIRDGGERINHLSITNSTFMNSYQRGFEIGQVREFIFLNNICADLHLNGRDTSLGQPYNPAGPAWIRIDSTGLGGENWVIGYSNLFYTQAYQDYLKFPFIDNSGDTLTFVSFFNNRALGAIAAGNWANTLFTEEISFQLQPIFPGEFIDSVKFGSTSNARPWNMSNLAPDPVYSQLPVGTSRFSALHNFNYDCNTQSNTGGVNGQRVGATLWGDCTVSVSDLFDQWGVAYYPNPVTDELLVQGVAPVSQLQLFDLQGRLLASQSPNQDFVRLPMRHLSPGIYLLTLTDHAGRLSARKIIKQ
ncbi:MAG: T9SS type A sorting domain-containing protein [Saprospiraceae bacterium]